MNSRTIILFFSVLLFACNNGGDAERKEAAVPVTPQYYYYPKANVYFDSANKEYVFVGNDGNSWQSAKQIPAVVQSLLDKAVLIQNPSQPVWQDNANHKLVYSALLYATPNDTVQKKETPKPEVKPNASADSAKNVKKERKGLRKILDKIFGRKKEKPKEEPKEIEQ